MIKKVSTLFTAAVPCPVEVPMSAYQPLGNDPDSSEEASVLTPMLELQPQPQPQPEPEPSGEADDAMVDQKLTLTIAPKAAKEFILKKRNQKRGSSGIEAEEFAAAMSTIPGLPKRKDGGELLSYVIDSAVSSPAICLGL